MRRIETLACVSVALLAGIFYVWTALQPSGRWATRDPDDYYPLQTAGFRSGHLYAAIEPDPQLLALSDPYDPVANAPYRVHDMSLYQGHYYLYFGVTPVIVLFWPVAVATGWYLTEPIAVALFCTGAVWTAIALLLAMRRRHFPAASPIALFCASVCVAFATPLIELVEAPQFYQVPISCAICLQALMLGAVYMAVHSPRRRAAWFAAAGLLFGLSVGARPNYLLGLVALLIPISWASRTDGADPSDHKRLFRRLATFAFVPAGLCGAGLMLYNWMRFGSVAEFGMHYQLAGERVTGLQAMTVVNLIPHLIEYLFIPGNWQSYFPFFGAQARLPYGLMRYEPWTWLVFASFIPVAADGPGDRVGERPFVRAVASASLINLAFLSCFYGVTSRYPGDFANAGLLLAGVGALALSQKAALRGVGKLAGLLLLAGAGVSLFFALAVFISSFPTKDAFFGLARAMDTPAFWWQRTHGAQFGDLRLELRLPAHPGQLPEPIFETGPQSDQRDWVQIDYPAPGRARLSLFHAGTGLFEGADFPIPADRRIVVEARCGSLLPPFSHPVFRSWSREDFDRERRDLRVNVNGAEVLRAALACYESSPSDLKIGRLGWFTGGMDQAFSGDVIAVARLPLVRPERAVAAFRDQAPVELGLYLPSSRPNGADPILLTGRGKQSDLVYCVYDGENRVRFALDHYGNGGPQSESVHFDPLKSHTLTIWMGSMAKGGSSDRLVLIFDGRTLLNVKQHFYPGSPESAIVGFNAYGSTAAGNQFTGKIIRAGQVELATLPPPPVDSGEYGAVEMSVNFPNNVPATSEPLVVTGATGAGDIVYVRYVDSRHIAIGFDHWGVGGTLSDPIEVDYGEVHRVAISMDSLYPAGTASRWSAIVRVTVDGNPALEAAWRCYPSPAGEITIARNAIGGSTCGSLFTGRVLSIERFPETRD